MPTSVMASQAWRGFGFTPEMDKENNSDKSNTGSVDDVAANADAGDYSFDNDASTQPVEKGDDPMQQPHQQQEERHTYKESLATQDFHLSLEGTQEQVNTYHA